MFKTGFDNNKYIKTQSEQIRNHQYRAFATDRLGNEEALRLRKL